MKKYLLPDKGEFYKANLHCHTDMSDGAFSPEKIKQVYKEKGYAIVAYTDHDIFIPHNELTDDSFLALNGYEIEVTEGYEKVDSSIIFTKEFNCLKSCHMCLIAIEPENTRQICWHRNAYLFGNAVKYKNLVDFDDSKPDFVRKYTPECISGIMKEGRDSGFFVTYNHPGWSLESYPDYSGFDGMHAMEIYNHGGYVCGYDDYSPHVYDDLLRQGKRIYCIAADDNHNHTPADMPDCDAFGGFTMIKADRLEYSAVTAALLEGNFYASTGPEINALWVEDGKIHIECSPASRIVISPGNRYIKTEYAIDSKGITSASFELDMDYGYVRITVTDFSGKNANTNAYFIDEIL